MWPSRGAQPLARALAWPLLALWAALAVASAALQLAVSEPVEAALVVFLSVLVGVGALLMRRAPENSIGVVLMLLALLITASTVANGVYLPVDDATPSLPVTLLLWFDEWVLEVWLGLVAIVLPLLFPDGRLPSPRWRPLLWLGLGVMGAGVAGTAFGTARFDWGSDGSVANPVAVRGPLGEGLRQLASVGDFAFVLVMLGSFAAVAVRLHRSHGVERQQLKWFAYAVGMLLIGLAAAALGEITGYDALGSVGWVVFLVCLLVGMPLAIAVAILRHRLYDIDVVIKRTLVYGSLTVLLVATYLGLVLTFRLLLTPVVGESDLAVAASTLAVAALFRPARSRIQAVVDRRFFRRRYDAARTIELFAARLRQEVDLQAVSTDLGAVVRETVQPAHVSLWLRSPG